MVFYVACSNHQLHYDVLPVFTWLIQLVEDMTPCSIPYSSGKVVRIFSDTYVCLSTIPYSIYKYNFNYSTSTFVVLRYNSLQNYYKMFPLYYMHCNIHSIVNFYCPSTQINVEWDCEYFYSSLSFFKDKALYKYCILLLNKYPDPVL